MTKWAAHKQQKCISHSFAELEVQGEGASRCSVWHEDQFPGLQLAPSTTFPHTISAQLEGH